MKQFSTTFALAVVMAAAPAFSGTASDESCEAKFSAVSEAWADAKPDENESEEVTLSTVEGDVEVSAEDAQPTENWFGKPPSAETVDGYIDAAEKAMVAGDEEACLVLLQNVEEAMSPGEQNATTEEK